MADHLPFTMDFAQDNEGLPILLKEGKYQVMMAWEKPYMEACVDALQPFGDVLEIGFGCGFSASHIQTYFPKSHTIIECHPEVIKKAKEWASCYPSVSVVEDTWQNALSKLGVFDAIFFDDYPLETENEMKQMVQEEMLSKSLVGQAGELLSYVHQTLPSLAHFQYSDADLIAFFSLQKHEPMIKLNRFLFDLMQSGQVKLSQAQKLCDIMKQEGVHLSISAPNESQVNKGPFSFHKSSDRLFNFLEQCLNHHMRKGSRFSCYLNNPTSKYEDKIWFEHIITNPFLDYEERRISVDVPGHCNYYDHNEALVITITKK